MPLHVPAKYTINIRGLYRSLIQIYAYIQLYLFSSNNIPALGLMTSSIIALITHKIIIIRMHTPLSVFGIIFLGPFLFVFDLITLVLLHRALGSKKPTIETCGWCIGLVIIICSASFVSLYVEANAEINWGRSIEVKVPRQIQT